MSTQTGSISFEVTGGFNSYAKQNYATLSQIKGQFATSSTGAGTPEKVATIVPENTGWTLYTGATVTVKFTSKNTESAPTLNVNNTGAKPIKAFNGSSLDSDAYNWPEGAAMSFTYDGSSWRLQDSDLMERVYSAKTAIEQNATNIALKANANDVYTKASVDGFISKEVTDRKAAIKTASDNINLSVSQNYTTKTEFNNLEIGGRNLYLKTGGNFFTGVGGGYVGSATSTISSDGTILTVTRPANTGWAGRHINPNITRTIAGTLIVGETYTISFDAKASVASGVSFISIAEAQTVLAHSTYDLTDSWQRIWVTFTVTSGHAKQAICFYTSGTASATYDIKLLKLEKGNKATDWTPAPEDIEERVSSAESAIIQNADNIALKVSTTDYNGNTVASLINQSAESVKIQAKHIEIDGTATFKNGSTTTNLESYLNNTYDAKGAASTAVSNLVTDLGSSNGTTVIDGSNIITGTVQANAIKADSGTFNTANIPDLSAAKITSGDIAADRIKTNVVNAINATVNQIDAKNIKASKLQIGQSQVTDLTTDLTNAGKTATTYITNIDTNKGITIKPSDSSGNDYLQINSTDIKFMRNNVDVMNLTDNSFRIGPASGYHSTINTSGLHIWNGAESTATNEVASFGTTARVGKSNSSRFLMNADSLQGYNSSNTKYFEVSANGLTWGSNTAATTTSVTEANNAANTVVTVYPTTIDYAAGTATLAVKCMRGTTAIIPSAWVWTKGTSTTSIETNSTLQVTDLNAVYNCTVTIAV